MKNYYFYFMALWGSIENHLVRLATLTIEHRSSKQNTNKGENTVK